MAAGEYFSLALTDKGLYGALQLIYEELRADSQRVMLAVLDRTPVSCLELPVIRHVGSMLAGWGSHGNGQLGRGLEEGSGALPVR